MSKELARILIPVKEEHQKPMYEGSEDLYNMVRATLDYDTGRYIMRIGMESHCGAYITMHIGRDMPPSCRLVIKTVGRRSKKADAEALSLFNALYATKIAELYGADTCYMETKIA